MAEITGILLAAGRSSRFEGNKLLHEIDGMPVIAHAARTLSGCDRLLAVVRKDDIHLAQGLNALAAETLSIETIVNPEPGRGMGYSIACGVRSAAGSGACCLLPADMPFISTDTTRLLIDAWKNGAALVAPAYTGQRGHPVLFSGDYFDALCGLDGDVGARAVLERFHEHLAIIETNDAGILIDIDTVADLETPAPNIGSPGQ